MAFYILAINKKQNSKKKNRNKMEIQNLNSLFNTDTNDYYLHKKIVDFFSCENCSKTDIMIVCTENFLT